jgi:hypothetical protein
MLSFRNVLFSRCFTFYEARFLKVLLRSPSNNSLVKGPSRKAENIGLAALIDPIVRWGK